MTYRIQIEAPPQGTLRFTAVDDFLRRFDSGRAKAVSPTEWNFVNKNTGLMIAHQAILKRLKGHLCLIWHDENGVIQVKFEEGVSASWIHDAFFVSGEPLSAPTETKSTGT